MNDSIVWKIYPTWAIEKVAKNHQIDIGDFLYFMATQKLSKDLSSELDALIAESKAEPKEYTQ